MLRTATRTGTASFNAPPFSSKTNRAHTKQQTIMTKHMNQRKLSKLWSSLFAVVMLLVGVSTSFAQVNAYDQSGTLIQSFLSCDASLQDAINATPLNGEVRILAATCNPSGA